MDFPPPASSRTLEIDVHEQIQPDEAGVAVFQIRPDSILEQIEISMTESMCPACGDANGVSIEECAFCRSQLSEGEYTAEGDCEIRMWCQPDCDCPVCIKERTKCKSTLVILLAGACVSLLLTNVMEQNLWTTAQPINTNRHIDLVEDPDDSQHARIVLGQQDGPGDDASIRVR